jgi:hypothetical protein
MQDTLTRARIGEDFPENEFIDAIQDVFDRRLGDYHERRQSAADPLEKIILVLRWLARNFGADTDLGLWARLCLDAYADTTGGDGDDDDD